MAFITAPAHGNPPLRIELQRKLAIIAATVAVADWLFYGRIAGISIVIFIILLAALVLIVTPTQVTLRRLMEGGSVLIASVLPMIEDCSLLSCLFAALGIAYFAIVMVAVSVSDARVAAAKLLLVGPIQIFADAARAVKISMRRKIPILNVGALAVWVVPIVLGSVFVALFASANLIIENWLSRINIEALLAAISLPRVLFWLAVAMVTWPFIFITRRSRRLSRAAIVSSGAAAVAEPGRFLSAGAILRSLFLFNLIFAIQTVMDMAYLWGGLSLPDGMTHADYAHRGAYPLIVTALLAGCFVVLVMRPGSNVERVPVVRWLVYVWIGQNILLVLSSILRLDLYVEVYSLTYLRAAAFIWMAVVAGGLALIVTRILLGRSNHWLVGANFNMLVLVLYACSFINFPLVIATYNVVHCHEVTGNGVSLDVAYLAELGPEVIPALDSYTRLGYGIADKNALSRYDLMRNRLAISVRSHFANWRAWGFRGWRLLRYLDAPTAQTLPAS